MLWLLNFFLKAYYSSEVQNLPTSSKAYKQADISTPNSEIWLKCWFDQSVCSSLGLSSCILKVEPKGMAHLGKRTQWWMTNKTEHQKIIYLFCWFNIIKVVKIFAFKKQVPNLLKNTNWSICSEHKLFGQFKYCVPLRDWQVFLCLSLVFKEKLRFSNF